MKFDSILFKKETPKRIIAKENNLKINTCGFLRRIYS